ncbi:uncharacterized protein LOC107484774 [Arachis duranensis]|uniref:Uncharacterized protein LOC107484774 n=1 Tax=Arachis duranensis TaxID=130453 RepID=A0A6P4D3K4_ARADU|nr:uncharacterized protein LOC107484774 [Arachis duranensis]
METPQQCLSDLATVISNLSKTTHNFIQETRSSIRNLEIQVGQLSKKIPEGPFNTLPRNTEVNPREECKVLTMGKEAEPKEEHATEDLKQNKAQEETVSALMHAPMKMKEPEVQRSLNVQKKTEDEQIAQFLAIFKKLQNNISFSEVLEKKPSYMVCLKNVVSEKKALRGDKTAVLTKECSALMQKKLLQKIPDPRSFLIPCTIGTITFEKAYATLNQA